MTILGAAHAFIYFVTVSGHVPMAIPHRRWLLLPIGMFKRKGPAHLVAYFWLGYFFITLSFTVVEVLIGFWLDHAYSEWPGLRAYSLRLGLFTARLKIHELCVILCLAPAQLRV